MTEELLASTRRYEAWLGGLMPLVAADLRQKHQRMRLGPFLFLRATFYRWCQLWPAAAGDLARATQVPSVGDFHLENYGTWRDADGRLIWGINDFDEATRLPWTQDLVRLAASAHLAIFSEQLAVHRRSACAAILAGYRDAIEVGGRPFVLEEEHGWLRRMATGDLRHPPTFWAKMNALPTARPVDPAAASAIERAMPARGLQIRFARRVAGLGSLGRPRFVGIANWNGGAVAREAKAMAPSAWLWAQGNARGRASGRQSSYNAVISRAVRVPDPTVRVTGGWLLRRLAPHCTRIDLAELPTSRDEERLLYAMGFEAANVHLGAPGARPALRRELKARRGHWLHQTASALAEQVIAEWRLWRRQTGAKPAQ